MSAFNIDCEMSEVSCFDFMVEDMLDYDFSLSKNFASEVPKNNTNCEMSEVPCFDFMVEDILNEYDFSKSEKFDSFLPTNGAVKGSDRALIAVDRLIEDQILRENCADVGTTNDDCLVY